MPTTMLWLAHCVEHEAAINFERDATRQSLDKNLSTLKVATVKTYCLYDMLFSQKPFIRHFTFLWTKTFPHSSAKLGSLVFNKNVVLVT